MQKKVYKTFIKKYSPNKFSFNFALLLYVLHFLYLIPYCGSISILHPAGTIFIIFTHMLCTEALIKI